MAVEVSFSGQDRDDLLRQIHDFLGELTERDANIAPAESIESVSQQSSAPDNVDYEDLKRLTSKLVKSDRGKVKEIFADLGATRLANVPKEKHLECHRNLTEALDGQA